MCTKHPTQMNLKIYRISTICTLKVFRICTHFWQCSRPAVTSQVGMFDSHFLPLDIAITFILSSVLFLLGSNLTKIVIDAGLDLVLESYPQHRPTPLLKVKCVSRRSHVQGRKQLFLWPKFVALSNRMHEIRDDIFEDLPVLPV